MPQRTPTPVDAAPAPLAGAAGASLSGGASLDQLRVGESAEVLALDGRRATVRRLLEMGLTPGTLVALVRRAPLGDPLEISVRGYHLTLRREEARLVSVGAPR